MDTLSTRVFASRISSMLLHPSHRSPWLTTTEAVATTTDTTTRSQSACIPTRSPALTRLTDTACRRRPRYDSPPPRYRSPPPRYYHPDEPRRRRHSTSPPRRRHHHNHHHHESTRSHHTPHRHRHSSDTKHHHSNSSKARDALSDERTNHAVKSAIQSAAIEAIRVRGRPGSWAGEKGARVATAAIGAAVTDAVTERSDERHTIRHKVGDLAGAWIANRAINGPVRDMGKKGEDSRSRRR